MVNLFLYDMNEVFFLNSQVLIRWPQAEARIAQAEEAFKVYMKCPISVRIGFLRQIASEIGLIRTELAEVCHRETHLSPGRLQGEIDRTINQIIFFADLLEEGSWVNAIIDTGDAQRVPLPKPDIRQIQKPIGPVCVYGASNFPFAFSVAGGDTISALAAGCPVVYKVHMGHPQTSLLVSKCIERAVHQNRLPAAIFSLLTMESQEEAKKIIGHPAVKALAFTGSFTGGKALYDVAVRRPDPIPVYAEMGSVNPVFLLPDSLKHHAEEIAAALVSSNTLGAGQFCTNPGLVFLLKSPYNEQFVSIYGKLIAAQPGHRMLTSGIYSAYADKIGRLKSVPGLVTVGEGVGGDQPDTAIPFAFRVNGRDFLENSILHEECFGPSLIFVDVDDESELMTIVKSMEGQLTASVWCTDKDAASLAALFDVLEHKAGRLILNGVPTGVEVCHAMVHGGLFPATTDARTTSVGAQAIYRFTRPVSYQNFPEYLLPVALHNDNPCGIWRKVNGELTMDSIR